MVAHEVCCVCCLRLLVIYYKMLYFYSQPYEIFLKEAIYLNQATDNVLCVIITEALP